MSTGVALTNYHKLGGLNNRNLLSHSSGGQKSEINVLAGLVPSESSEGESIACLSSSFWWLAGHLLHPLA